MSTTTPGGNAPTAVAQPLPEAPRLGKVIGPGIVLVAGGLGSGELILWPSLTANFGLGLLWLALLAIGTQYFINMEMARYTLATGEGVTRGLGTMWRPWYPIVIVLAILPYFWPGWAVGAATLVTFAFGGGNVTVIAVCALLAIATTLTLSPVVYRTIERIQTVFVVAMVLFIVVAITMVLEPGTWAEAARGLLSVGAVPEGVAFTVLLSAVGAAGAGGAATLAYSNFLRDKGQGMAHYTPKIVSPFTGEEQAVPGTSGVPFDMNEQNLSRWRGWWRVTSREQILTFVVTGALGIAVMCAIAYQFLFGTEIGEGFAFLDQLANTLGTAVAGWVAIVFLLVVGSRLLSTNVFIIDVMGRVTADAAAGLRQGKAGSMSESRVYVRVVWAVTAVAIAILLFGFDQPLTLLILGTALNGSATFVFAIGIILLNRRRLPQQIRLRGFRLAALLWACVLYGTLSAVVIVEQFQRWL